MEMERLAVMKTFNGSLSQQSMFDVTEPRPLPYGSSTPKGFPREASFSSYLRPDDPKGTAASQEHLGCEADDSEISIFDAQKYFNEENEHRDNKRVSPVAVNLGQIAEQCDLASVSRLSSVSSVDGYCRSYRTRSCGPTPTASISEASWNSHTGLLSNPPGSVAVSLRNLLPSDEKKRGSSAKWFFGSKCPCAGKKSVQVEEKLPEPHSPSRCKINNSRSSSCPKRQGPKSVENVSEKPPNKTQKSSIVREKWEELAVPNSHGFASENHFKLDLTHRVVVSGRPFTDGAGFSFPILNPSHPTKVEQRSLSPKIDDSEEPPRESLEVFRPRNSHKDPQSFAFPASPKSPITLTVPDDEAASDASSDLFEIESLSTQPTSYPTHPRQDSLDEASNFSARRFATHSTLCYRRSLDEPIMPPSIAPTECYAPSEASIDWSVTTAEGFDRGSVANFSEAEDATIVRHDCEKSGGATNGGGGGRRGNGLWSCRCEKAVSVGSHWVKGVGEGRQGGPALTVSSTLKHVSCRPAVASKPPLAKSHSARLSLPFPT